MTFCEAPYCTNIGDPYDCMASPAGLSVKRYFCSTCAPRMRGVYFRMVPAISFQPLQYSPVTPAIAPGTLCSMIGCTGAATFEGTGLIYDGSQYGVYSFKPFQGALCQRHYKAGWTALPAEWDKALAGSWP